MLPALPLLLMQLLHNEVLETHTHAHKYSPSQMYAEM